MPRVAGTGWGGEKISGCDVYCNFHTIELT